jgi:hypothetical protein
MIDDRWYFWRRMSYLDKLIKIETLIQRAASEGERQAAQLAKDRILNRILEAQDNVPTEFRVTLDSPWKKRLFVALCAKHGLRTYRYPRQKHTTVRLRISKNMMDNVLWPEFLKFVEIAGELIDEIMKDLTNKIYKVEEAEMEVAGEISR